MNPGAGQFFSAFFAALERHGLPYVVLHSYRNFPGQIDSDVDYAVRDADIPQAHALLRETAVKTGWQIVQTLQYDIGSHYSVIVNPQKPGEFLKLDRCSHYTRNGCLFIRDEVLLAGRRKFNGFYVPALSSEFIYTLAKVFAKGKPIAGYLASLRELSAAEPARSQELFLDLFGPEQGKLQSWFDQPPELWNQLAGPMHQRNRYRLPQRLLEWRRRWRRTWHPSGLRTVFLGLDDDEVSQVISRLELLLDPCFRKQMEIPFCPKSPHLPPRAAGLNWLKILRCFFAQWRQHLVLVWPAYRRSTHLIFAGSFDDFLIRPGRYRLQPSGFLVRVLRRLLPKPEFTFVLETENQKLNQGRPELEIVELRQQQSALRQLAVTDRAFRPIASPDTETTAQAAWREIIEFLARRDRKRWEYFGPK